MAPSRRRCRLDDALDHLSIYSIIGQPEHGMWHDPGKWFVEGKKIPSGWPPPGAASTRRSPGNYILRCQDRPTLYDPCPFEATRKVHMLLSPVRESTRVIILQHDRPGPANRRCPRGPLRGR
mgnify:CR=1 FL=1